MFCLYVGGLWMDGRKDAFGNEWMKLGNMMWQFGHQQQQQRW
jgi:hypothetical protein